MNILILSGSPKGEGSITLQTCLYLQRQFARHQFRVLHVGRDIRQLERDFGEAVEMMQKADMLLFCYPVYTFMVPSQLHRFVELMKEHVAAGALDIQGKWATQVTTSKHFYDITAHRFIEDNAKDLGLRVLPGLSADMEDLLKEEGRAEARSFFDYVLFQMRNEMPVANAVKNNGLKVALGADLEPGNEALGKMVERFCELLPYECKLVNIREFPFKGGCLSCFNCSSDGKCVYNDGFDTFLRSEIQTCDAIVYAFSIRDHSMGSRFKMYDDRQFCNGHRTVTMGCPTGYLVNGAYAEEGNLQMVLEGRVNVGGNYLCGVAVNDGVEDAEHRIMSVEQLVMRLAYALDNNYRQPSNFLGVGGMKIFRDLIYQMRGLMRADHKFFKSHGQYDFPQKQWRMSLKMYIVGWLINNKGLRRKLSGKMTEGMLKPYKETLNK